MSSDVAALTEVWAERAFGVFMPYPAREGRQQRKIPMAVPCSADFWTCVRTIAGELGEELAGEAIARLGALGLEDAIRTELRKHHPDAHQIRVLLREDRGLRPNFVYIVRVRFYLE